jgi:trehalose synthase-fused probable maltokinase
MAPMESGEQPLNPDPTPFDAGWLASRRWFRSKSRPLREVVVHDAMPMAGDAQLLVLAARFADGGEARYLLPAVGSAGHYREPPDGAGAWRWLVAQLFSPAGQVPGRHGSFALQPTAALADLLPGGLAEAEALEERRLQVEQSNTSVRLGDRLMLKLYRLLEPGINPEVEMTAFLTDVGFRHAPLAAGWASYLAHDAEPAAAAIVQALVPARGDAWGWMLERLPTAPQGPVEALAAAAEIGGITAELHAALRARPEQADFPARPATADELERWRTGALEQLDAALAALDGEDQARLARLASPIRDRFEEIGSAAGAGVSRIHGDYHLGQLLATASGFAVTDFEGEPARPLDERRQPASPLRDVAGMLRSFDYAARTAERGEPAFEPEAWLRDARAAFLAAYGGIGESPLLAAFELEKACYELRYEANYRPEWVWLPLGAVERLVA